ncbi:MAG: HTH-type transcriptional activator RhaS [Lentisphaerae bacterium ADurb.Bin242]|nr:MAG: HTH-type transcriptional activator RhaS [Lentisphaerae bacterium ADurb.Bin242]
MPDLADLSEKKLLYLYHSAFFKLFHIPLDWVKPNNKTFTVCGKEHCHPLCACIMEHAAGARLCEALTAERIQECRKTRRALLTQCHAGLYDLLIPIFDEDDYLGCLCAGQFILRMPSTEEWTVIHRRLSFLAVPEEKLLAFYKNTPVFSEEQIEGLKELLFLIIGYICETYGKSKFLESASHSSKIATAEVYIQKHYTRKLTVGGIARSVGMSESYFLHEFSKQTGSSPIVYLNSYRIARAVELLRGSNLNISEAAFSCGFQSVSHFNRIFRRITGKTPGDFRIGSR